MFRQRETPEFGKFAKTRISELPQKHSTVQDNELENYITGPLQGIIEARVEAYDTLGNMEIQCIDSTVVRLSVAPLTPLLLSLQYEQQEEARVAAHNKQVAVCSRPFKDTS